MTKRTASYDIDPLTYEEKEKDNQEDNLYAAGAPQIKGRKIYKLARKTEGTKLTSQSKPDLKIVGLDASFAQKDTNQKNQTNEGASNIFKRSISGLAQAGNLFSKDFNNLNSNNNVKTSQVPKAQEQTNKPKFTLFGSLFSQGPSSSASSIFSNNNKNSTIGSLFSFPGKSLFGGINLFSPSDNSTKPAFFTKDSKNEDGEDEGDSAELQKKQQMIVDPSKSQFKFDYGKQNIVLKTVRLLKFKKDKGELLDCPMNASLLRDHSKEVYFISIELQATHKIIFSGLILKGKSVVKTLNSKSQNLEILAFNIDPKQKKIENHILKLQISTENKTGEEIEFLQTLNQIIEGKSISGNLGDTK